ncbi:MAG: J domain-containing protein, partial [Telluria sp.]
MARIHTHYDNLKVSRKAPQEVIRAAYKALSQKYHPDKNPGDVKAARIMAILNSAYGTLADPVRRHEHDEWIAAEEWEIEWLESTRADEGRELLHNEAPWEPELIADQATPTLRRNPAWWLSLGLCLVLGCMAGIL